MTEQITLEFRSMTTADGRRVSLAWIGDTAIVRLENAGRTTELALSRSAFETLVTLAVGDPQRPPA